MSRPPMTTQQELEWRIRQFAPIYYETLGYDNLWTPLFRDKVRSILERVILQVRRDMGVMR